jgi:hypothetical protein
MPRRSRAGDTFASAKDLRSVAAPLGPSTRGSYRDQSRAPGGRGGTLYPTVLEAYNRDSDFKRWLAGAKLWEEGRGTWSRRRVTYFIRSFRNFGIATNNQLNTLTLFSSFTSPEGAWATVTRERGAVILLQPLLDADMRLEQQSLDPARHRLVLNVSKTISLIQLREWQAFIGDQFEDSAINDNGSAVVATEPDDVVALTLTEVRLSSRELVFDLSRPFLRARRDPASRRGFWVKATYRPQTPLRWRGNGSRFLASAYKISCNCPDYTGIQVADTILSGSGTGSKFPLPSAGRTIGGRWEGDQAGYLKKWRDLSPRSDQRRECKHIHAVRWSLGYPFYEPSDYPVGEDERQFGRRGAEASSSGAAARLVEGRQLELDRVVLSLAASGNITVDARDSIPEDEAAPANPFRGPILWTTSQPPRSDRARADDWWLRRGSRELLVFDPRSGSFVRQAEFSGVLAPVIEEWPEGKALPSRRGIKGDADGAAVVAAGVIAAPRATGGALAPASGLVATGVAAATAATGDALAPASELVAAGVITAPGATGSVLAPASELVAAGVVAAAAATGEALAPTSGLVAAGAITATEAAGGALAPTSGLLAAGVITAPGATGGALTPDAEVTATGTIEADPAVGD